MAGYSDMPFARQIWLLATTDKTQYKNKARMCWGWGKQLTGKRLFI